MTALASTTTKVDIKLHGKSHSVRLESHIWTAFRKMAKDLGESLGTLAGRAQRLHNGPLADAIKAYVERHSIAPVYKHGTREAWLDGIVEAMRAEFAHRGYPLPAKIQTTMGFPSTGWRGKRRGECWNSTAHAKGWVQIFIHPCETDVVEIVNILTHELCHAADEQRAKDAGKPYKGGYGRHFKAIGIAMDLEGKPKYMAGGAAWLAWAQPLIDAAGPMPYDALARHVKKEAKQTTRMLKCECPECGAIWRTSRKVLEGVVERHATVRGSGYARQASAYAQCIDPGCTGRIDIMDLLADLEDEAE